MADFFENFGKKVTEVAEDFGKMAEDTIEVQKIKSDIRSLNRANERDYTDIGRMIYDKFQKGEVTDTECISLCSEIERRDEEVRKQQEQIEKIRGGL